MNHILTTKLEELFYEVRENGSLSQVSKDNFLGRLNELIALSKQSVSQEVLEAGDELSRMLHGSASPYPPVGPVTSAINRWDRAKSTMTSTNNTAGG